MAGNELVNGKPGGNQVVNTAKPAANPTIWALLVGIDRYQANPELHGCVNDVLSICNLLMQRYSLPETQIKVLTNEAATRSSIIHAFKEFLTQNAAIDRGDQILFYYSGHGSQMPALLKDAEPDRLNETIVPHDSRLANVFDIPDKTLGGLIRQLVAAKSTSAGDNITIVLDCCHSGSGTRAAYSGVRGVPPDPRPLPSNLDSDLLADLTTRGGSPGATTEGQHVLLTACKDEERTHEYVSDTEDGQTCHGAFSFILLQTLAQLPPGATYADLHQRAACLVTSHFLDQHPQCEGDRHRQLFRGVRVQSVSSIPVLSVSPDGREVVLGTG